MPTGPGMLVRNRVLAWMAIVLVAVAAGLLLLWPGSVPTTSGPLRHEAYLWQRVWTREMTDRVVEATGLLADAAAAVIRNARAGGLSVEELQLDFDCPESKLDGYRAWVVAIRQRLGGLPFAITALPSWLDSPQFAPLARASGAFVLQVHALERPQSLQHIPPLCDPRRARRWVERAAKVDVPFRVALPTYRYLLSHPDVNVCLTGPSTAAQMEDNLRALAAGPLDADEMARIRCIGEHIYGKR